MTFINRLEQTAKQIRLFKFLYYISRKIIDVSLFYLVREGLSNEDGSFVKPKIDDYYVGLLNPLDMEEIAANPEVPTAKSIFLKRLSEGCLCIGIKHRNKLAAYMWCNLRECDSLLLRFKLENNEAYLRDARTFTSYRGKNLAPYLRVQLYQQLRQMERTTFYSITEYFNMPAQRFKEKLNAKPLKLYAHVKFFKNFEKTIILKTYTLD